MKPVFFMLFMMMLIGMPAAALAIDNKVFNGAACQPLGSHGSTEEIFYGPDGTIRNTSDDFFVMVTCPIVRDNVMDTTGLLNVSVRVFVPLGTKLTPFLGCSVSARDGFGGSVGDPAKTDKFVAFPGVANQTLEFTGDNRVSLSFPFGQYILTCSLPPRGIIFSYLVIEGSQEQQPENVQ
jgi:hypothetical protein